MDKVVIARQLGDAVLGWYSAMELDLLDRSSLSFTAMMTSLFGVTTCIVDG